MDRAEAFETFRGCVGVVLDVDVARVVPEARWAEDLDADSLAVVEITLALDDAFSIKIPDVPPGDIPTVGAAFDVVAGVLAI